ncbi:hypothetical protein [Ferrimicrobium acidiphilum]|uniref:hypothetical protein n=1 Tax=Ferrimicrobium acidiphilum TaxID=121039 RepID=UPI0023F2852C|nr:hypothetical protein [Ferrimicrobium acidiphilum]
MYYARENQYGSNTDYGFANTWHAVGFATKAQREAYCQAADNISVRPIPARELPKYGGNVGHVSYFDSTGQYHEYLGDSGHEPIFELGDGYGPRAVLYQAVRGVSQAEVLR